MISQCPQLCLSCIASHTTRTLCHLVVMEYPKKSMIRMHHKSITYLHDSQDSGLFVHLQDSHITRDDLIKQTASVIKFYLI